MCCVPTQIKKKCKHALLKSLFQQKFTIQCVKINTFIILTVRLLVSCREAMLCPGNKFQFATTHFLQCRFGIGLLHHQDVELTFTALVNHEV